MKLKNRSAAGRMLADTLAAYAGNPSVLVLGLPRGGAVVAAEVARALGAPLDIFVVIRLGVPSENRRLTIGALTSGDVLVFDQQILNTLRIPEETFLANVERARQEMARREHNLRGDRPPVDVRGKTVILVDDGIVTGATMRTAIAALRQKEPASILIASPITPASALASLKREVDGLSTLVVAPDYPLLPLSEFYEELEEVSDAGVRAMLELGDLYAAFSASTGAYTAHPTAATGAHTTHPTGAAARPARAAHPYETPHAPPGSVSRPWTARRLVRRGEETGVPASPPPVAAPEVRRSPDATHAAPGLYRPLLENETVRVLEFRCEPGSWTPIHRHPACVVYALSAATVSVTYGSGRAETVRFVPGEVLWVGPQEHAIENIGSTSAHLLIVEMKAPGH